jgi:hypothetical protein
MCKIVGLYFWLYLDDSTVNCRQNHGVCFQITSSLLTVVTGMRRDLKSIGTVVHDRYKESLYCRLLLALGFSHRPSDVSQHVRAWACIKKGNPGESYAALQYEASRGNSYKLYPIGVHSYNECIYNSIRFLLFFLYMLSEIALISK